MTTPVLRKVLSLLQKQEKAESESLKPHSHEIEHAQAQLPNTIDGSVSVVNGDIQVVDPENMGSFPTLVVPDDARLSVMINGQRIVGEVVVTASQQIVVRLQHEEARVTYNKEVSSDNLSVKIRVDINPGKQYRLFDCKPSQKIILNLCEIQVPPTRHPSVAFAEIINLIKTENYIGLIDHVAVQELSTATVTCERKVLSGTPPIPGRPATYKQVNIPTAVDAFLGKVRLSSVSTGACIAVYDPGVKGRPGRDVFGNEIPIELKGSTPILGDGVISVNGNIVAVRGGRVVFTKRKIDVIPEKVIDGHVSARDGRISFDGNIVILGDVQDGAYVRAGGSIIVRGNIHHATVLSDNNVTVKGNIVSSTVIAGSTHILYSELTPQLVEILTLLERFKQEYLLMVQSAMKRYNSHVLVPRIAGTLLEKRHIGLIEVLQSFVDDYSPELLEVDQRYRELIDQIRGRWQGIYLTNISSENIEELVQSVTRYSHQIERSKSSEPSVIQSSSITTSTVRATGNILVTGTGTFSSNIESWNSVTIQGTARGGFIAGKKAARIRELGTQYGSETSVRVDDPDGLIMIGTRHSNTLIEIHGTRNRSYVTETNVRFLGGQVHDTVAIN